MLNRTIAALIAGLSLIVGAACGDGRPDNRREFRVAAYFPDYRAEVFDEAAASRLTDLIVFSVEPTASGAIDLGRLSRIPWERLRTFKTQHRVRIILCVGGWGKSKTFASVATSAEKRKAFAKSAVKICLNERFDGIDIDWEHPRGAAEEEGYGKLLAETRLAFKPHGLMLSVTVAAWQKLTKEAVSSVDYVQVMAYDHDGRHSTFEGAAKDVKTLLDKGVPAQKVVLGMPFYGRDIKKRSRALTYRQITVKGRHKPEVDEIDGVYFNGPATIQKKTRFALDSGLGGVMVWEIGQDAEGENALLRVIHRTVESKAR